MRMNKGAAQLFFRGSVAACCCNVQTCKRRRAGVVGRRRPDRKNPKMLRLVMVSCSLWIPYWNKKQSGTDQRPWISHGGTRGHVCPESLRRLSFIFIFFLGHYPWDLPPSPWPFLPWRKRRGARSALTAISPLSFGENKIGKLSIYEKNRYHTGVTVFLMNWTLIKVCGCTLNFLINEQRRNTYGGIWNLPISPTTFVRLRRRTGKETDKYSIWETSRPIPTVSIRRDIVALEIKYRRLMVLRAHRVIVSQLFFYAEKCLIGKRIWIRARRVCMCATSLRIDFLGTYLLGA